MLSYLASWVGVAIDAAQAASADPEVRDVQRRLIRAVGDTDTSLAFAAVTVFSVFGVLLWRAAEWVERRVLPWHPSQRETLLLRDATT